MKLDRNTNPDGTGKYALINLRKLSQPECPPEYRQWYENLKAVGIITTGSEAPGEQFFVMKYKDKFTPAGLQGYAAAVRQEPSMEEYAAEMEAEAKAAASLLHQLPS